MLTQKRPHLLKMLLFAFIALLAAVLACARAVGPAQAPWSAEVENTVQANHIQVETTSIAPANTQQPVVDVPILTPTPDVPKILPTLRSEEEQYIVQAGDSMGRIAERFGISLDMLIAANDVANPNILEIGTLLTVPPPVPGSEGSSFKIIPDSELVYGPGSAGFDTAAFVRDNHGYLAGYTEEVDGITTSGADILQRISQAYSINPRLLLAVLEYTSGWVRSDYPDEVSREYPLGILTYYPGLYHQLAWAANNLNAGYYNWKTSAAGAWVIDSQVVPINPTINAGTAAVQYLLSLMHDRSGWDLAVSEGGIFATYQSLFGYPFHRAFEPLIPNELSQPTMILPFEAGQVWSFTGGPHAGWSDGSPWAALDFAPPGEPLGCVQSNAWVTAVADGPIIRAGNGEVMQDIATASNPSDGFEGTGWTVLYMHIESRDRVEPGTYLYAGDRIGHPSCEGGYSTGTHLHLARRYNGEWISADGTLPFILDGWIARGTEVEYNGYLLKENDTIEAWEGTSSINAIQR